MKTEIKPKARLKDIVVQNTETETLIYDLSKNKALCLNETSAIVWKLADGTKSVAEIKDAVEKRSNVSVDEEIINLALYQLRADGLLEENTTDYLDGLSRRELIRKVGFAAVIALPTVSMVVAPNALAAQSLLPLQAACTANGECASGNCTTLAVPALCCNPGANGSQPPGNTLFVPTASTCPTAAFNCCSASITDNGIVANPPFPGGMARECECAPF